MIKKPLLLFCIIFTALHSFAQNRISEHNTIGWYALNVDPAITKKWSAHLEYQWRRDNIVTDWQQSLLRLGLTYKINPQVSVQAGYGWIVTFPYSETFLMSVRKTFPEHRIYEQVVTTSNIGNVKMTNRLRFEQRWLGKYSNLEDEKPPVYPYVNRIRYMPRIDVPLDKMNKVYAALFDEIFVGFGKNVGQNVFDQNRIGVMVGYNFSKGFKLEGGFLNQTVQLGRLVDSKNVFQYNNGLLVTGYVSL